MQVLFLWLSVRNRGKVGANPKKKRLYVNSWGKTVKEERLCVNSWGKIVKGKLIKTSGDNQVAACF
jgi:hypothetical protein